MATHLKPRLQSGRRIGEADQRESKEAFRQGRGRRLNRFTEQELNPILQGWGNYFQLVEVDGTLELEQWMRRNRRQMLWRQWKRSYSRPWSYYQRLLPIIHTWLAKLGKRIHKSF